MSIFTHTLDPIHHLLIYQNNLNLNVLTSLTFVLIMCYISMSKVTLTVIVQLKGGLGMTISLLRIHQSTNISGCTLCDILRREYVDICLFLLFRTAQMCTVDSPHANNMQLYFEYKNDLLTIVLLCFMQAHKMANMILDIDTSQLDAKERKEVSILRFIYVFTGF